MSGAAGERTRVRRADTRDAKRLRTEVETLRGEAQRLRGVVDTLNARLDLTTHELRKARRDHAKATDLATREEEVLRHAAVVLRHEVNVTKPQVLLNTNPLVTAAGYSNTQYFSELPCRVQKFVTALVGDDALTRARVASSIMGITGVHRWPLAVAAAITVKTVTGSAKAVDVLSALLGSVTNATFDYHLDRMAQQRERESNTFAQNNQLLVMVFDNIAKSYKGLFTARWVPWLFSSVVTNRLAIYVDAEEFHDLQKAPLELKGAGELDPSVFAASASDWARIRTFATSYVASRLDALRDGDGEDEYALRRQPAGAALNQLTTFPTPRHRSRQVQCTQASALPSQHDRVEQLPVLFINPTGDKAVKYVIEQSKVDCQVGRETPETATVTSPTASASTTFRREWCFVVSDAGAMPTSAARMHMQATTHFVVGPGHECMNLMRSMLRAAVAVCGDVVLPSLNLRSLGAQENLMKDTHKGRDVLQIIRAAIMDKIILSLDMDLESAEAEDVVVALESISNTTKMNAVSFFLLQISILDAMEDAARREDADAFLSARRAALPWWWARGHNIYAPLLLEDLAFDARCVPVVRRARHRAMFQAGCGTDFFMEQENAALKDLVTGSTERGWRIASRCRMTMQTLQDVFTRETGVTAGRTKRKRTDSSFFDEGIAAAKNAIFELPRMYDIITTGENRVSAAARRLIETTPDTPTIHPPGSCKALVFTDDEALSTLSDDWLMKVLASAD